MSMIIALTTFLLVRLQTNKYVKRVGRMNAIFELVYEGERRELRGSKQWRVPKSQLVRLQAVVKGAEPAPCRGRGLLAYCSGILGENDGEAYFQMPVNVAVEEPGTRVVGDESKRRVVGRVRAGVDNIADYRIIEIIGRIPGTANNEEVVSVKMDRVR